MFRWGYVNTEKVFYCSYKMILNTISKAGESSLISSGFNSNAWQKLFLKKNLHFARKFHTGNTILENLTGENKYMLFAGWEVCIVKNCDRGLENAARSRRPKAAFSSPRSELFTLLTNPRPANNILFYFFAAVNWFYRLSQMVFTQLCHWIGLRTVY